jgi:hypothetical protein
MALLMSRGAKAAVSGLEDRLFGGVESGDSAVVGARGEKGGVSVVTGICFPAFLLFLQLNFRILPLIQYFVDSSTPCNLCKFDATFNAN